MLRWPHVAGFVAGLTAGACLLSLSGSREPRPSESGPILSECDGHIRCLVIHYEPSAKDIAAPVYRQLLGKLESDVTVQVVCPDATAYRDFMTCVGPVRCKLVSVIVRHALTTWSRDRWVALASARTGGPTTLWSPRGEAAEEIWPARAGDERVAGDIAAASGGSIRARRSSLYFDGGDFLADGENVFVIPRVLQRNLQHTVVNRGVLLEQLAEELKRRVIVLEEAPDHHAGMFMASVGNRTMLVGDPSLGKQCCTSDASGDATKMPDLPSGADFSPATQHLFDAVAARCEAAGYRVVRIPTVLAPDGRTYLTYVNALIDQQGERRFVYLPCYEGAERMNQAASNVWRSLGYEVQPIDCTSTYRHFGCLHCLVNVTKRDG